MDRTKLVSELYASRLVAVVRSKTPDEALALAQAAAEGGIKFIEITFSVPGALDVIKALSARKNLHVGAGTVLAPQQAERAIGVGAEFVVSPSLELNLIGICHTANIACFPGAATPTEIIAAQRAHADLVKIFPADLVGGAIFYSPDAGTVSGCSFHGIRRRQLEKCGGVRRSRRHRDLSGQRISWQVACWKRQEGVRQGNAAVR